MARAALQLYLLRHADAGDPEAWEGDDAARPLSEKGTRQAERLALHLSLAGFEPDRILTSPKLRSVETAEIVASALGLEAVHDDRLAESLTLESAREVLRDAGDVRRPVLVGHEPDLGDLLSTLVGARVDLKKGALARVDLDDGLDSGVGRLRWLLPPDLLPAEI